MNPGICLHPNSINFNINSLSGNGFAIYTDADNFTFPIAVNIPASLLFPTATGNCQFSLSNIPAGANQILVVDQCDGLPPSTPGAPDTPSYTCCYALLTIPDECISWCDECSITFDTFQTSSIGKLVAGNLTSTCGTVTDYVIGWYLNGDYSAPALTTGFGSAAGPYQFGPHPLTGNSAVPVVGGSWEGIIHDIVINGTLYSSVSGSKGGTPIPFESCFGTFIIDPLSCNNGTALGKYSHQYNFNSQTSGTLPVPTSLTYALDSTTKYFAYAFKGLSVWDELEIKWISGDPNATSNPSLYSQPIYLEKLRIGGNANSSYSNLPPGLNNFNNYYLPGGPYNNVNNYWPKFIVPNSPNDFFQRVLTLTTLETSSNPATPDFLEITVTPNPANNNTQWQAGFQCLTDFDCTDCMMDNWPNNLPKIYKIHLQKQYGCDAQKLTFNLTSSCLAQNLDPLPGSDWMGPNINSVYNYSSPLLDPTINLIGSNIGIGNFDQFFPVSFLPIKGNISCNSSYPGGLNTCGPSSTGTITFNKTPSQIQLTFNLESDYLYYKNALLNTGASITTPLPCPAGSTSVDYYKILGLKIPIQGINANCGDNSTYPTFVFHQNDYLNTQYVENASSNFWSITIPQTSMVNCYPINQQCDSCYNIIQQFVNTYNSNIPLVFSFTTNVGAKLSSPFSLGSIFKSISGGINGSYCITYGNSNFVYAWNEFSYYGWYNTHTLPFLSSSQSSTGWVNLPNLGTFIPCSDKTGSYSIATGIVHAAKTVGYSVRFLHLTSSGFDYSLSTNDFEIYTEAGFGITGSSESTSNVQPSPCPDPLSALIYSYIGGVATVHTSSHFWQGNNPILVIDP